MARRWLPLSADSKRAILDFQKHADVIRQPLGDDADAAEEQRGWGQVVFSFYGGFLRFMRDRDFKPFQTPVHAVGYDWRQSNLDSATLIAREINRILTIEHAEKFILISHSMGGLATRSVLSTNPGLSGKLEGILHVMQPVGGAAVFYRRMYTGNISPQDDKGLVGVSALNIILGDTAEKFAKIVCGLRGPTELMPTPNYTDGSTSLWINFFLGPFLPQALGVRASDWFPYKELAHPPGLVDLATTDASVLADMRARVVQAKAFHDGLGLFKHDKTWAIFSTGVETDMAFFQDRSGTVDLARGRRNAGDGTVPSSSATLLFPGQTRNTLKDICNGDPRQFVVPGVEHAPGMGDSNIQALAEAIVKKMLGMLCFGPPPPPRDPEHILTFEENIQEIEKCFEGELI